MMLLQFPRQPWKQRIQLEEKKNDSRRCSPSPLLLETSTSSSTTHQINTVDETPSKVKIDAPLKTKTQNTSLGRQRQQLPAQEEVNEEMAKLLLPAIKAMTMTAKQY